MAIQFARLLPVAVALVWRGSTQEPAMCPRVSLGSYTVVVRGLLRPYSQYLEVINGLIMLIRVMYLLMKSFTDRKKSNRGAGKVRQGNGNCCARTLLWWTRMDGSFENVTVAPLLKKFSAFYGPRPFIAVFTRYCQWNQS
jgi:hypothetical protein